ncbi:MAG: SCO family protein [Pseudomonadota bacterium]
MKAIARTLLVLAALLALPAHADATLPGNSVYRLAAPLADQAGKHFSLAERRGKPALVSMFYNSCEFVCPMLIDTMRMTEEALSADERSQLAMLLITFDPARDSVAVLRKVADQRQLDAARWTVARPDPANARKIAAVLDIKYRQLANGEFSHTTVLVLLDKEGRVVGQTNKMGVTDPAFVALIHKTLQH